jgi:hypothetical protein
MTWKQLALWSVLVDFAAFTAYAVYAEGYFAFVPLARDFALSSAWGLQVLIDFALALTVTLGFVVSDARRRGLAVWPFVVLTLTLGSIGPLAYLVHRERQSAPQVARARAAAQHA